MRPDPKFDRVTPACERASARADAGVAIVDFERFTREQYPALVTFLSYRTSTRQDAEDAAQESMARMLRYRASEPAAIWPRLLYRIAINVAHDQYRVAVSHQSMRHVNLEEQRLAGSGPSPEEQAIHEQRLAYLRKAVTQLPPKCQRVYLLKRVHCMSHAEVAKLCGISVKTVEKHLAKALIKLRRKVGELSAGTFE